MTKATATTNLIQPISTNAKVVSAVSNDLTPTSISTQLPPPMTPVFISPSGTPSATPVVTDTPDDSTDDTASVITGVAFAGLILFIVLLFIMKRKHQKCKDLEVSSNSNDAQLHLNLSLIPHIYFFSASRIALEILYMTIPCPSPQKLGYVLINHHTFLISNQYQRYPVWCCRIVRDPAFLTTIVIMRKNAKSTQRHLVWRVSLFLK
ncbi:hypothetical protein BGW37DRAFT_479120 [Umbelopsis sp. PMI_123]|nr:hypothetical protein BGW37DRAFT_479120 [Umbelopsis sp. PMI_123]